MTSVPLLGRVPAFEKDVLGTVKQTFAEHDRVAGGVLSSRAVSSTRQVA